MPSIPLRRRMTSATSLAGVFVLLMVAAFLTGCSKSTYLVLHFEGASLPAVYGIRVSLTDHVPDGTTRMSTGILPSDGNTAPIRLPTSAAFQLDGQTGSLDILAEALDAEKNTLATQSIDASPIRHGQTWNLTVTWDPTAAANLVASPTSSPEAPDQGATQDPIDDALDATAIAPVWLAAP